MFFVFFVAYVSVASDVRIGLDLDEHLRGDQLRHLHHRRGRPDRTEDFPMRAANQIPTVRCR